MSQVPGFDPPKNNQQKKKKKRKSCRKNNENHTVPHCHHIGLSQLTKSDEKKKIIIKTKTNAKLSADEFLAASTRPEKVCVCVFFYCRGMQVDTGRDADYRGAGVDTSVTTASTFVL